MNLLSALVVTILSSQEIIFFIIVEDLTSIGILIGVVATTSRNDPVVCLLQQSS